MSSNERADAELAAFVTRCYPALLRTGYLLTGTRTGAEDLVQASLVKCVGAWRRSGPPDAAEAYLRTAMVRQSLRWRARRASSEVPFAEPPDVAAPDDTGALAEAAAVRAALRRLPPQQRAVLVLRFWEQRSEAEIAATLRISPGTVKSRTSRGLAALREHGLLQDDLEVRHG